MMISIPINHKKIKSQKRLVSLVLPTFGSNAAVTETLLSIKQQTIPFDEIIIVDDNPIYDIREDFFLDLLGMDSKVVYLKNATNIGSAASLNLGIKAATGEIIVLCNDDDLMQPSRNFNILNKTASLIKSEFWGFTSVTCIDQNGQQYKESAVPQEIAQALVNQNQGGSFLQRLKKSNIAVSSGNLFFSRPIWNRAGGFNTELIHVHDWEMAIKLAILEDPVFIDDEIYSYRIHPENSFRKIQKEVTTVEVKKVLSNCEDFFWLTAEPDGIKEYLPELLNDKLVSQPGQSDHSRLGTRELRLLYFLDALHSRLERHRSVYAIMKFVYKRVELLLIRITAR